MAEGMGISLEKIGRSLVMTRRDFERLRKKLEQQVATKNSA